MTSLTIRELDPSLRERLRVRAADRGHSMETEARAILETVLTGEGQRGERGLAERICGRFAALGGVELEPLPHDPGRPAPEFD